MHKTWFKHHIKHQKPINDIFPQGEILSALPFKAVVPANGASGGSPTHHWLHDL